MRKVKSVLLIISFVLGVVLLILYRFLAPYVVAPMTSPFMCICDPGPLWKPHVYVCQVAPKEGDSWDGEYFGWSTQEIERARLDLERSCPDHGSRHPFLDQSVSVVALLLLLLPILIGIHSFFKARKL